MRRARGTVRAAACAFVFSLIATVAPAVAQAPPAIPPGGTNINQCGDAKSSGGTIRGNLANADARGAPVSVSVMPENPLSIAYVRNLHIAFADGPDRERVRAAARTSRAMDDALMLATRQGDLIQITRYVKPTGWNFACRGLSAGRYLVLATFSESYPLPAGKGSEAKRGARLAFYASEVQLKERAVPMFTRIGVTANGP